LLQTIFLRIIIHENKNEKNVQTKIISPSPSPLPSPPTTTTTTTTSLTKTSQYKKGALFESARWRARKKVIHGRMVVAFNGSSSRDSTSTTNESMRTPPTQPISPLTSKVKVKVKVKVTAAPPLRFDVYNDINTTKRKDGRSRLGSSLSSSLCSIPIVEEESDQDEPLHPPPSQRPPPSMKLRANNFAAMKFKMNSCTVLDSDNNIDIDSTGPSMPTNCALPRGTVDQFEFICLDALISKRTVQDTTEKDSGSWETCHKHSSGSLLWQGRPA